MSTAKYQLQLVRRKFSDFVKRIELTDTTKSKINMVVEKIKVVKISPSYGEWDKEQHSSYLGRFIRTIREVFGFTAVMSVSALFILGVLCLSFILSVLLGYFHEYAGLILGLAVVMIGVGWYKPFKLRNVSLTLLGTFLVVVTFGSFVVEGYTGRNLADVNFKNGYWLTLKATFVFVTYLMASMTFVTWIYLISKKRRQNPLRWFRYVKFRTKNE